MSGLRADAVLELVAAEEGGVATPIESRTRSLLLKFAIGAHEISIGAAITTPDAGH